MVLWPLETIFENVLQVRKHLKNRSVLQKKSSKDAPVDNYVNIAILITPSKFSVEHPEKCRWLFLIFLFLSSAQTFISDCSSGHVSTTCLDFAVKKRNLTLKARK